AALGAAADAVAVSGLSAAAEALRMLRKEDAGRAALLLATPTPLPGVPEPRPGDERHAPSDPGGGGERQPGGGRYDSGQGGGEHGQGHLGASGAQPLGFAGDPVGAAGAGGGGEPQVAAPVTGLPEQRRASLPAGVRYAADLVAGGEDLMPAVRVLLRDVVVVESLEDAEALVGARPELTAVTAEGDLLAAHTAVGGSAKAPSLLEVQAQVDEATAELERLEEQCAQLADRQQEAKERRSAAARAVDELGQRRRAAEKAKSSVAQQLGRLGGQARAAAGEADRAATAVGRSQESLAAAREEFEELSYRLSEAQEEPGEEEPDTSVRDRLAADGANARQTEMEARLQLRTHEERVKGLAGRADGLDRAARAERETRARAERRRLRLAYEASVAAAVRDGARGLLDCVQVSLARAEAERVAAEQARAEREAELGQERRRGRELKSELDRLTGDVHKGEVLGAEKRLRIEQLEARALEEHGMEPAGLVAEYGPDQPVPPSLPAEGEVLPEDPQDPRNLPRPFVRPEQEKRLKAAEKAYAQLGKVNPLALEEFAALEERHKFLTEQLEDLRKTRADLLQVVKDVDERVEQVFTAAFHDTAREFEGVFSRLFPGGEGRLLLTDPDNMLTTGVDVEARPPGKKVKRLSLLSGGERSLTAVAMLVSIFKARPSPFYVMDEVEAALDDTNLQRLIRIMEELQESSQLIVITHQKRTMEVADALYGVSMQGDGVSKVISQRLREGGRKTA
ncbi:AAA family ATPase, partial [Actinacidiphila bryophytorum]